ncbi:hypothetical protein QCA50_007158 [Cerrena zonata]|uniref:JmjC domain-containing protein n=1 Tax=Cerrena zonata TaxID=2478898 RepID=A0AAW0GHG2_9APHY
MVSHAGCSRSVTALTRSHGRTRIPPAPPFRRGFHSIDHKSVITFPETTNPTSLSSFRRLVDAPDAVPLLFRSPSPAKEQLSRAKQLTDVLKQSGDTLVEVEHGRYDQAATGSFDRVEMPLGYYVNWLESNESDGGLVGGKQLYLAQWRPGEVSNNALKRLIRKPTVLSALDQECTIDSYGNNFFIGPTGAVTPLHYDPYINLFHLQASSLPKRFAKHVTLFPPSVSHLLRRETNTTLRNTSPHELTLRHTPTGDFDIHLEPDLPNESIQELSNRALSCLVREGDTLLIPKRWWHRVENVDLAPDPAGSNGEMRVGWTAAVSWWFLLSDLEPQEHYINPLLNANVL